MEDFREATIHAEQSSGRSSLQERPKLSKPIHGMVKANWDTALDLRTKRMGVGMIIRDEEPRGWGLK